MYEFGLDKNFNSDLAELQYSRHVDFVHMHVYMHADEHVEVKKPCIHAVYTLGSYSGTWHLV